MIGIATKMLVQLVFVLLLFSSSSSQISRTFREQPNLNLSTELLSCCDSLYDSKNLFSCVNSSITTNNDKIVDQFYSNGGPNLLVGVVSFATENIQDYTSFSFAVNAAYADHNNYILHLADPTTNNFELSDSRWSKVKILVEALNPVTGWARDVDYLMWIDADLIFLDMGMRIEMIASEYPSAHFFSSAEHAGSTTLINSGSILVRNTVWTREFLGSWWDFSNRTMFSDQEQFDLLYKHHIDIDPKLREKVIILQPDAINSDPPAMTQQKEYNQVLHLMGEQTAFRVKTFKSGFSEICRYGRSKLKSVINNKLAHQLTVTQENLLRWTIEVYSNEAIKMLKNFKSGAAEGQHSMLTARELSNSVHHYCHALEHPNRGVSEDTIKKSLTLAIKLRTSLFEMMTENLNAQRKMHLSFAKPGVYPYSRDWPEHVKTVATAGQHLLSTGSASFRASLASEMMTLMEEMLATSSTQQHDAIYHMIAHLFLQKGMIDLLQDMYDINSAYANFKQSLDISIELAKKSGEHILVQPLTMCANVLSTLERHQEAFPMYQKAIYLSELHLGPTHDSLSSLLVNYGISLVQVGEYRKSVDILERAVYVMDLNDPKHLNRNTIVYQRAVEFLQQGRDGLTNRGKRKGLEF